MVIFGLNNGEDESIQKAFRIAPLSSFVVIVFCLEIISITANKVDHRRYMIACAHNHDFASSTATSEHTVSGAPLNLHSSEKAEHNLLRTREV